MEQIQARPLRGRNRAGAKRNTEMDNQNVTVPTSSSQVDSARDCYWPTYARIKRRVDVENIVKDIWLRIRNWEECFAPQPVIKSIENIAYEIGYSDRAVSDALKWMHKNGWLVLEKVNGRVIKKRTLEPPPETSPRPAPSNGRDAARAAASQRRAKAGVAAGGAASRFGAEAELRQIGAEVAAVTAAQNEIEKSANDLSHDPEEDGCVVEFSSQPVDPMPEMPDWMNDIEPAGFTTRFQMRNTPLKRAELQPVRPDDRK
jgi:hypothetical protein